ncbi:MAG: O-antigen ligase family protein [Thermoanaerobaculales bacterium]|nr:O-antigen ligase family protein [Thermoanaerobaculales bacterium]
MTLSFLIAPANFFLGLAILTWVAALVTKKTRFHWSAILIPTLGWALWSAVSAWFSQDRIDSLTSLDNLLTLLLIPMTLSLLTRRRWDQLLVMLAVASSLSSAVALWQTFNTGIDLQNRAAGLFSHYMTFAGWTMAVVLVLAGEALRGSDPRKRWWILPVLTLHTVLLAVSLTRNAWVGLAAGLGTAALLWRPKALLAAPLLAVIAVAILPAQVRDRVTSIGDFQQHANRDRVAMARAGIAMAKDHPLVGVGPEQVKAVYPSYRLPEAVREDPSHLHNNPIHIAAERGIPALAVWFAFLGVFFYGACRALRNPEFPASAAVASSLIAIIGLVAAGFFEYNWGDSEIWYFTLFLLAVPFSFRGRENGDRPHPIGEISST